MNIIYQIRTKTCEDLGDTYRSNTVVYSDIEQAVLELKKEASSLATRLRSNDADVGVNVSFSDDFSKADIKLSDISYAQVWIEKLLLC